MFNGQFNHHLPKQNVCFGCEVRRVGCHTDCQKYLEFKAIVDDRRKKRAEYIKADNDVQAAKRKAARK